MTIQERLNALKARNIKVRVPHNRAVNYEETAKRFREQINLLEERGHLKVLA